jgi:alpha-1,2-glucosyltransferase
MFSNNNWKMYVKKNEKYPANAVFPAYHFFAAIFAQLTGECTPDTIRLFGVLSSFALFLIAYLLALSFFSRKIALLRAMQIYFLPFLFPFYFLIYTDTLSVITFLLAFYFTNKKRYTLSGFSAFLCILVRQNAIIFVPFLILYSYFIEYGFTCSKRRVFKVISKCWANIMVLIIFAIFLLIHGRIALNEPSGHPLTISLGNIIFSAIFCMFLFLPESIMKRKEISTWINVHKRTTWAILAGSAYVFLYNSTHPWNMVAWLVRNEIIQWLTSDIYTRIVFFALTALAFLTLFTQKLKNRGAYLIYPFWVLMLLPALLVEPRYYIIPFVLFVLLRKELSFKLEITTLIYFIVISILIHLMHTNTVYVL